MLPFGLHLIKTNIGSEACGPMSDSAEMFAERADSTMMLQRYFQKLTAESK